MTSFDEFHRQRRRDALQYARSILRSDGAEDACQEAWLRAWRSWGSADPERVDAWLRAIIRNCCWDLKRHSRSAIVLDESIVDDDDLPSSAGAEEVALAALDAWMGCAQFDRLSPNLREALWLRAVMDFSYAEIAEAQRVPVGTVMSRLHAARTRARQLYAEGA